MVLFDMKSKKWITLFEETHSPVGRNRGGALGTTFGNTITSKDGLSLEGSPHSTKKLGYDGNNSYSLIKPMTYDGSSSPYRGTKTLFGKKKLSPGKSKDVSRNVTVNNLNMTTMSESTI